MSFIYILFHCFYILILIKISTMRNRKIILVGVAAILVLLLVISNGGLNFNFADNNTTNDSANNSSINATHNDTNNTNTQIADQSKDNNNKQQDTPKESTKKMTKNQAMTNNQVVVQVTMLNHQVVMITKRIIKNYFF